MGLLILGGVAAASGSQASEAAPRPSREQALALAQDLLDRVRDGRIDEDWLRAHMAAPPYGPLPQTQVDRWTRTLASGGPVASRLAELPGPVAAVEGPDSQRVILEATPGLSAVVELDEAGEARVRELAWTSCGLCSERVRFVADLLEDVRRRGRSAHRLLPGVDLDLDAHHREHKLQDTWIASISLRNGQGRHLPALLRDARVVGEIGDRVQVRYADGVIDPWPVIWRDGLWRVDYAGLEPDSPLRLDPADSDRWSKHAVRASAARDRWQPSFQHRGPGLVIADGALDAWPDPRDGTILVLARDVDKALAAVFRVDPETRTVLERLPGPSLDVRTQIPLDGWLGRWPTALSPDARHLAVTGPNRLWIVDLQTGRSRTAARGEFDWVGFVDRGRLWAARGTTLFEIDPVSFAQTRQRLRARPVGLLRTPGRTTLIDGTGADARTEDAVALDHGVCCGQVVASAPRASGSATLLTCGHACPVRYAWVDDTVSEPISGGDAPSGGASCSPGGTAYTTAHPDGLAVWTVAGSLPLQTGSIRHARWVDEDHLVTIDLAGQVTWWDLTAAGRTPDPG